MTNEAAKRINKAYNADNTASNRLFLLFACLAERAVLLASSTLTSPYNKILS